MAIYYLEPRDNDTTHKRWAATNLREGCWVLAQSEDHARLLVQQATLKMVDVVPGESILHSPWLDAQLTECRPDAPHYDIQEGIIFTASGKTIS
jgi:hypothetical protein